MLCCCDVEAELMGGAMLHYCYYDYDYDYAYYYY